MVEHAHDSDNGVAVRVRGDVEGLSVAFRSNDARARSGSRARHANMLDEAPHSVPRLTPAVNETPSPGSFIMLAEAR